MTTAVSGVSWNYLQGNMLSFQHVWCAGRKTKHEQSHFVSFASKNVATRCAGINVRSAPSCMPSSLLKNRPALAQIQGVLRKVTLAVSISARNWGTPPESQCAQLSLLAGHHKTICFLPLRIALISFHPKLLRTVKCLLYQDWCSFGGVGNGKIHLKCNKNNYFFHMRSSVRANSATEKSDFRVLEVKFLICAIVLMSILLLHIIMYYLIKILYMPLGIIKTLQ